MVTKKKRDCVIFGFLTIMACGGMVVSRGGMVVTKKKRLRIFWVPYCNGLWRDGGYHDVVEGWWLPNLFGFWKLGYRSRARNCYWVPSPL